MTICKDLGLKTVLWQSVITTDISLSRMKDSQFKLEQEKWGNCGIYAPHLEYQDKQKNRNKVVQFLDANLTREGLVSIKDIADELKLTEEFVLSILKEFDLEITEE